MPLIRLISQSDSSGSYESSEPEFLIGRSEDNHFQILDKEVSRRHARVSFVKNRYVIESLGLNPVEINGRPIKKSYLENEDFIVFGDTRFHVKIEGASGKKEQVPSLVLKTESGKSHEYPIKTGHVIIGRSAEADIPLNDRTVSRKHCSVELQDGECVAVSLSENNPLIVNNKAIRQQRLYSGDRLLVGPYNLTFVSIRPQDIKDVDEDQTKIMPGPVQQDMPEENKQDDELKTMMFSDTLRHEIGPRLILDTPSGTARTYFLNKDRTTIGRSEESDIHLESKTVSRQHCAIEKEEQGYIAVRLSSQSPVIINNEKISRQRLYSGDQLQLGSEVLSFVSDKSEDVRSGKVLVKKRGLSPIITAASTFLILVMGAYLAYLHFYIPWDIRKKMETADQEFSSERYDKGREIIESLLLEEISVQDTRNAKELLAEQTLKHVRRISESGSPKDAKKILTSYLKEYGGGREASLLWYEIDRLRFDMGKELEKAGKPREALQEYSLIRADSFYYPEANKAIRRIWLAEQQKDYVEQQKQQKEETLAKLLLNAENSSKTGQYLLPVKNSAYSFYQAVLTIEPENSTARKGISDIKGYYQNRGSYYFDEKQWSEALDNFEKYTLIDPDNSDINEKINICQANLSEPKISTEKSTPDKDTVAKALEEERRRFAELQKQQKEETLAKLAKQKEETLATLLKKAENSFQAKQYLKPLNNNAYSFYQAVLTIDPENDLAGKRIGIIHSFYKNQGNQYFEEEKWEQALESFESYTLMNPDDSEIIKKIKKCKKSLDSQKSVSASSIKTTDRLERALKDSGIESSRVMKYFTNKDEEE